MHRLLLICFFLFVSWGGALAQKKITIKESKSVIFFLEKDSTVLSIKESKLLLNTFYCFYDAVAQGEFEKYRSNLSPETLDHIIKEKIKRKFGKFQSYNVHLKGQLNVRSIKLHDDKTFEKSPVYVCIIQLPEGVFITQRVGFDPLKRAQFKNKKNYVALHFVKTASGYRVVIPW